ncbi:MAG: sugar isomerase [Oscillospiraceae bacterium]|nr:sugar isomerase [Oscillospiraceae bacterium]
MKKVSNTKKSAFNIIFGIGSQIVIAVIGIILPRMFIVSYGSEVNGFLSSINQVLTYVVLLELGIGTASLQALYKPVAAKDHDKISGVLSATSRFYTRTAILYVLCVVILAAVFPFVVHSNIPIWEQIAVILIVGGSGSIGYFLHAKYRILLNADGKQYIYTNAYTIIKIANSILKIVLILLGQNIVFIQLGHMLLNLVLALYITRYTKKHYPWLNLHAKPDKAAISQKNNVVVHEISQMVFNHTDVLLLTLFTDFTVVSIYTTYMMVVDIISTLINNINNGFVFRLGQLYNVDKERYKQVFDTYETGYMLISVSLYCVTYLFLAPFIKLYVGDVKDANYVDAWLPILFVAIKMLVSGRALSGLTISFAQHFKLTQGRSILEMIINLAVSIVGVFFYGIYGVLFGTIAALLYRANDMILYSNRRILKQSPARTYLRWAVNIGSFAIAALVFPRILPLEASSYFGLVWKAAVYTVAVFALFTLTNWIFLPRQCREIFHRGTMLLASHLKRKEAST